MRAYLEGDRKRIPEAKAAIDEAVDCLYQYTDFRRLSHELFRAAVKGRINPIRKTLCGMTKRYSHGMHERKRLALEKLVSNPPRQPDAESVKKEKRQSARPAVST